MHDLYQWVLDNQWAFDGILGAVIVGLLGWGGRTLWNRWRNKAAPPAQPPPPERGLIDTSGGSVNDSKLTDIRMRGADYLIKGNVSKSEISQVDFE